jgi:hypothetical protein
LEVDLGSRKTHLDLGYREPWRWTWEVGKLTSTLDIVNLGGGPRMSENSSCMTWEVMKLDPTGEVVKGLALAELGFLVGSPGRKVS